MIQKLKRKFILINMIIVVLVLGAVFAGIYINTASNLKRISLDVLEKALEGNQLQEHKKQIGSNDDSEEDSQQDFFDFGSGMQGDYRAYSVFVVTADKNGIVKFVDDTYVTINDWNVVQQIVTQALEHGNRDGVISSESLRYLILQNNSGYRIAFADISAQNDTLSDLIGTSLLVGSIALAVFFLISVYFARWAFKPIEKSWNQQKQFVADASHELRTPITTISANADIILSHENDAVQTQKKWIESIKQETKRMGELVNQMLYLAKSEIAEHKSDLRKTDLSAAVTESLLTFESVVFEHGKKMVQDIQEDIFIEADASEMKQLLMILLDNAVKYSDEQGTISVTLRQEYDKVSLQVNNSGKPIEASCLPFLFERFYRPDTSRTRDRGGYGLGLAIANKIVDRHNSKIAVQSNQEQGTTFMILFPLIKK